MSEIIWTLFNLLAPLVAAWAILRGLLSDRLGLVRCALVIGAQWLLTWVWNALLAPVGISGQPFLFGFAMNAIATWLILREPAGREHSVLAGATMAAATASGLCGAHFFFNGFVERVDWIYWYSLLGIGWATLAILLGWTHADSLRRALAWSDRQLDRLFRPTRAAGVAR